MTSPLSLLSLSTHSTELLDLHPTLCSSTHCLASMASLTSPVSAGESKEQLQHPPPNPPDSLYEEVEVDISDDDEDLLATPLPSFAPLTSDPSSLPPTTSAEQTLTHQFLTGLKAYNHRPADIPVPLFIDLPPPPPPPPSSALSPYHFLSALLSRAGLHQSLSIFQSEFNDSPQPPTLDLTPDLHLNEQLHSQVEALQGEVGRVRAEVESLTGRMASLTHQRDFHRLHHRRVLEEKGRMERDLRRLEVHYGGYDELMARMKREVERGQKERMLAKIEKEKMKDKLRKLQEDLTRAQAEAKEREREGAGRGPSPPPPQVGGKRHGGKKVAGVFPPPPSPPNPFASTTFPSPSSSSLQSMSLTKTFPAHQAPVSTLAFHPTKSVLCTGGDDALWKLWGSPRGELIMTGEGHKGWVSDVKFVGDRGTRLVTGGGDGTVKLWDLLHAECVETYGGGGEAVVWGVDVHHTGDLVIAGYLDTTARAYDLHTGVVRVTLRGHGDAVNAVQFLPLSSTLLTASADHTLALWDLRAPSPSPLTVMKGHTNAVLSLSVHQAGVMAFSVDADGGLVQWDLRAAGQVARGGVEGNGGVYDVAVDRGGRVVVTGGEDGVVRLWDVAEGLGLTKELRGHEGRVDAVAWDPSGAYVVSGGADNTWRIWA